MSDLISRDDAIEAIKEMAMRPSVQRNADTVNGLLGAMNIIYDLPAAQPEKQIPKRPLQACGHALERFRKSIPMMNYCPICGQRIDWRGEENG